MIESAPYVPPTETFNQRLKRWWSTVRNPDKRRSHMKSPVGPRKYYTFYLSQSILVLLRILLNFAGFWLISNAIGDVVLRTDDYSATADIPYIYVSQTVHALQHSTYAHAGGWLLLASTILHLISYANHRYHLVRTIDIDGNAEFPAAWFWLAQVSVINWFFDISGVGVPTVQWTHIFILLFNLTGTLVFVCILYFEEPLTLAWGCYAPGTPIAELKYGLCPGYINNPQNAHTPVCDQPGSRCGEEVIRWKTMYRHIMVEAFYVVMASVALYATSIGAKINYYVLSRELVFDMSAYKTA